MRIKAFFSVGNIIKDRKTNMVYFVVSSLADLTNVIIPHFLEYPLLTPLASFAFVPICSQIRIQTKWTFALIFIQIRIKTRSSKAREANDVRLRE